MAQLTSLAIGHSYVSLAKLAGKKMGVSDLVDRIFNKPYLDERAETYHPARDLALALLGTIALLGKIRELLDSPHPQSPPG